MPITLEMTMTLINRTAVSDIGRELYDLLPPESAVRYWRFFRQHEIRFNRNRHLSLLARIVGRLAMQDFALLADSWRWPRRQDRPMLFIDPLFCARTRLDRRDIVLCHDLGPITHPEFYEYGTRLAYQEAYRAIHEAAPGMVFVSEYTKRTFETLYSAQYRSMDVIPLYMKSSLLDVPPARHSVRSRPFILMVGGLEKRKNYPRAITAFRESGLGRDGYDLIITGPRGNHADEIIFQVQRTDHVEYLGYVGLAELRQLYETAEALFFPSLLEGFGVPALEAGRLGLFPVVSAGTVLEEVVGPGGAFVDPFSISSMAEGLREAVAMSPAVRAERLARVAAHQGAFTKEEFDGRWSRLMAAEAQSAVTEVNELPLPGALGSKLN